MSTERPAAAPPLWRTAAGLATAAVLLAPASSQSWATIVPTQPILTFGVENQLLSHDAVGLVGFDEAVGRTLLPSGTTWQSLPSAIPPRQLATICTSMTRVYLFGGIESTQGLVNEVWRFDRPTQNWTQVTVPLGPSPRFGAVATPIEGGAVMLFFGGTDASGVRNDTWVLVDLGLLLWSPQPTPPGLIARTGHAMASGRNQSAVLFGGQAGAALGDTWIFRSNTSTWTQHLGNGPPPAANCRMIYDLQRQLTVLLHPNGETWEWNDFSWRRVPTTSGPASWNLPALGLVYGPAASLRAFENGATGLSTWEYTPSLAYFDLTLDLTCSANGVTGLELVTYQNSLPFIGQTFNLRVTGTRATTLCVGAYELSTSSYTPWTCGCVIGLTGVGTGLQFVPGTTTVRDWALPIAPSPALNGVPIDVQAFLVDPAQPCLIMTSQRGQLIPGF